MNTYDYYQDAAHGWVKVPNDMSNNMSNTGSDSADFDWADYMVGQQDGGSVFDWADDNYSNYSSQWGAEQ